MNARAMNMSKAGMGWLLLMAAGTASGQFTAEYASGLLHTSVGAAQLSPPVERRLPVHNLGSSGQDGVEINAFSAWGVGGGVQVDLGTSGAEVVRYKGWDGTIKGKFTAAQGPGGMTLTVDFSAMGATGVREIDYDENGQVISDELHPPIYAKPIVPDCPPPSVPVQWYWRLWDSNTHQYVYQWMWTCLDHVTLHGEHLQDQRVFIPQLPVGTPGDNGGVTLMDVRTNRPTMNILDSQMMTFGVQCSGLGQAIIEEECKDGTPCAVADRHLPVRNIGSSGQDGVSIDLGGHSAGGWVSYQRKYQGWDLKEATKFYDEDGAEMMRVSNVAHPGATNPSIEFDARGVGDGSLTLEVYDHDHNLLGSSFCIPNVGGTVVLDPSWMCFPPSYPVYGYDYNSQKWIFLCCSGGFNMVMPDGTPISNGYTMEVTPTSQGMHRLRSLEITGADDDIVVESVTVTPCSGDVTHDGIIDLNDFFQFLNDFDQTQPGADIDGNPGIDLNDFFLFLNAFDRGC